MTTKRKCRSAVSQLYTIGVPQISRINAHSGAVCGPHTHGAGKQPTQHDGPWTREDSAPAACSAAWPVAHPRRHRCLPPMSPRPADQRLPHRPATIMRRSSLLALTTLDLVVLESYLPACKDTGLDPVTRSCHNDERSASSSNLSRLYRVLDSTCHSCSNRASAA